MAALWLTRTYVSPRSRRSRARRFRISACTDTSSAEVGSSSSRMRGSSMRARAIDAAGAGRRRAGVGSGTGNRPEPDLGERPLDPPVGLGTADQPVDRERLDQHPVHRVAGVEQAVREDHLTDPRERGVPTWSLGPARRRRSGLHGDQPRDRPEHGGLSSPTHLPGRTRHPRRRAGTRPGRRGRRPHHVRRGREALDFQKRRGLCPCGHANSSSSKPDPARGPPARPPAGRSAAASGGAPGCRGGARPQDPGPGRSPRSAPRT